MINNLQITVSATDSGARLDIIVRQACPSSPRSAIGKAIENGTIQLNGRTVSKGAKVREGDIVTIRELREKSDIGIRPDNSISPDIVYDDGVLIGVNKPAGIPVQPLSPDETDTLMNGLVAFAPELAGIGDDPMMGGALHRIDTGTSGLVLASRSQELWVAMRNLFAARKVRKTYLALVEGTVKEPGKVACDLAHDPTLSVCRMIKATEVSGKTRPMYAETEYKPIHTAGKNTLLEVTIYTGVTHQIRAQLAMNGTPIVGDALYGARQSCNEPGHRLHALAAEFTHPLTGNLCRVATPMPHWA